MIDRRAFIAGALLLPACSTSGGGGSGGGDKSKFKLDKWRIQLPVNDSGGFSGSMKVVDPAKTVKPWFIASDDKLEFTCPAVGATSGGTNSPRTELREDNEWRLEKGGVLEAVVSVDVIPSGSVTVGQVWGSDQPMRLGVRANGDVYVSGAGIATQTLTRVMLGKPFTYRAEVKNTQIYLRINGMPVWERDASAWAGKSLYFKAGTYCHAASGTDPKALFKATFTDLNISH